MLRNQMTERADVGGEVKIIDLMAEACNAFANHIMTSKNIISSSFPLQYQKTLRD